MAPKDYLVVVPDKKGIAEAVRLFRELLPFDMGEERRMGGLYKLIYIGGHRYTFVSVED